MTTSTTTSKVCFKCGEERPLSEFYKHPQMRDGHVNKCKECNKVDVRINRKSKVDYYREYDRKRGSRQSEKYRRQYRKDNPEKYSAHIAVNNAVRDGKLDKSPCSICGCVEVHAHHPDYSKPMEVEWLCAAHHKEAHG